MHLQRGWWPGLLTWAVVACGDAGGSGESEPTRHPLCDRRAELCASGGSDEPGLSPAVVVAPSAGLPDEVESQDAHNNLDIAWHDPDGTGPTPGRLFFAFRTAPDHFASKDTVMYVVSTEDLLSWRFEGRFARGTDLREPQLVSLGGRLLFYYVILGDDPFAFEPQGTEVVEWLGPGRFGEPLPVFEPGFLVWRIKALDQPGHPDGWVHAFGYTGGENIYAFDGEPISVHWLKSRNGLDWEAVVPERPVVLVGGASETDGVFLDDGGFVAVSRNEAGDESGFGMKICRAGAEDLGAWECRSDPRKYDSPLMLRDGAGVWLIGRRNLTETGHYDLGLEDLPMQERSLQNQLDYWQKPKRCALWKVDADALEVSHVLDLPSKGDTCFAEAVRLTEGRELVFNYSSPFDGDDEPTWLEGQTAPTRIYYTVLGTGAAAP